MRIDISYASSSHTAACGHTIARGEKIESIVLPGVHARYTHCSACAAPFHEHARWLATELSPDVDLPAKTDDPHFDEHVAGLDEAAWARWVAGHQHTMVGRTLGANDYRTRRAASLAAHAKNAPVRAE